MAIFLSFSALFFAQEAPKILKTKFSPEALSQKITNIDGKKVDISEIFKKHSGQIILIDFWASWCKDCIQAISGIKALKEKNPDVDFIYFSLDRSEEKWRSGLKKFEIENSENYWFDEGWQNRFNKYIDLNWIPRFMVINQRGGIAQYYAIVPDDPEIQKTIDALKK